MFLLILCPKRSASPWRNRRGQRSPVASPSTPVTTRTRPPSSRCQPRGASASTGCPPLGGRNPTLMLPPLHSQTNLSSSGEDLQGSACGWFHLGLIFVYHTLYLCLVFYSNREFRFTSEVPIRLDYHGKHVSMEQVKAPGAATSWAPLCVNVVSLTGNFFLVAGNLCGDHHWVDPAELLRAETQTSVL